MVVNFICKPVHHFKIKDDIRYPFRLNKEIIKLITAFSNESFDEHLLTRCNKQVISPRFQNKGTMLLK